MAVMLEHPHPQATRSQFGNQPLQKRRLARPRLGDDRHHAARLTTGRGVGRPARRSQ